MSATTTRISFTKAFLLCGLASMFGFLGGVLLFWKSPNEEEFVHPGMIHGVPQNRSLTIPDRPQAVPVFDQSQQQNLKSLAIPSSSTSSSPSLHQNRQKQLPYTEFLVHPALLVHPNPQHVAIWTNDWDSAQGILEQVQKHPSVTEVSVLLKDDSAKAANDTCTATTTSLSLDNVPTATSTVNGHDGGTPHPSPKAHRPRVQVYDLMAQQQHKDERENVLAHTVDVLFVDDVSGPVEQFVPIWEQLLRLDQGILLASLPTTMRSAVQRVEWMDHVLVQRSMFEQVTDYVVPATAFDQAHWFAVAFVQRTTYAHWHLNEADFAYRLRERHISAKHDLIAFDSATMASLRFPSRVSENAFCQYTPDQCGPNHPVGIDLYASNTPRSQLEVKRSGVGDYAGRGVFSTVDIPANSYLDLESTAHPIRVPWKASKIVWDLVEENDYFEERGVGLHYFFEGYGFSDEPWGFQEEVVDSSLLAFINHGCNSTYNIGSLMRQNEFEVDVDNPPEEVTAMYYSSRQASYNPRKERNKMTEQSACLTCKPIRVGDEILDNYLTFGGITHFKTQTLELRDQCLGASGEIERFQETKTGASLSQRTTTDGVSPTMEATLQAATTTVTNAI